MMMTKKDATALRNRIRQFEAYEAWERLHPVVYTPDVAAALTGQLCRIFPIAARPKYASGEGVIALHRNLSTLNKRQS